MNTRPWSPRLRVVTYAVLDVWREGGATLNGIVAACFSKSPSTNGVVKQSMGGGGFFLRQTTAVYRLGKWQSCPMARQDSVIEAGSDATGGCVFLVGRSA